MRQIAIEEELQEVEVFFGYALGGGQWSEHCWCMHNNVIIETTGEMTIYYGAALNAEELTVLEGVCHNHDPLPAAKGALVGELQVFRFRNGFAVTLRPLTDESLSHLLRNVIHK